MKTIYNFNGTLLLIILFFVTGINSTQAQTTEVTGRVSIWNNIPLENISVVALKSKQQTVTDNKGEFRILIEKKDKLKFVAEGFINKKVSVRKGDEDLSIEMGLISSNYSTDDELANDGFRYIPKQYQATAITKLKEQFAEEMSTYGSVWDMIRGKCAGVVVVDNQVYMREGLGGNLSGGSTPAIVVVNGTQVPHSTVDNLNPQDVQSISLLKGGAAAIYGGSGGNGVVVINLK